MTVDESLIAASNSNNPSLRLADYVQLSLDPANGKTFWHIAEYFNNGQRTDVVGVFQIASDYANDIGVIGISEPENGQLTNDEQITVTVKNFGENDQSNFPLSYRIDEGTIVTETYTNTIPSGQAESFTFSQTADMSLEGNLYHIDAWSNLDTDEFNENDSTWKEVQHLNANDIGVIEISTPNSGSGLSSEEEVSVIVRNFGYAEQTNFDISYNYNDQTITEQVPGPLGMDSSLTYSFVQTADLYNFQTYNFTSYTSLTDDVDL